MFPTKTFVRQSALYFLVLILPISSWGGSDLPEWIYKQSLENSEEKFYLGSSARLPSHAEAIEYASKAAMEACPVEAIGLDGN